MCNTIACNNSNSTSNLFLLFIFVLNTFFGRVNVFSIFFRFFLIGFSVSSSLFSTLLNCKQCSFYFSRYFILPIIILIIISQIVATRSRLSHNCIVIELVKRLKLQWKQIPTAHTHTQKNVAIQLGHKQR